MFAILPTEEFDPKEVAGEMISAEATRIGQAIAEHLSRLPLGPGEKFSEGVTTWGGPDPICSIFSSLGVWIDVYARVGSGSVTEYFEHNPYVTDSEVAAIDEAVVA